MAKATYYFVLVVMTDILSILVLPIVTGILNFTKIIILKINFSFDRSNIVSTFGSNYGHYGTSLGSIKNVPIAVGGESPKNKKVEKLQNGRWTNMGDFPFVNAFIYYYSLVTFDHSIFIFGKIFNFYRFFKIKFNLGGWADGNGVADGSVVAKMDENGLARNIWTKMGDLLTSRNGHRSIVMHNQILHVGGEGIK